MKTPSLSISILGPPASGKTLFIGGLFNKCRHPHPLKALADADRLAYRSEHGYFQQQFKIAGASYRSEAELEGVSKYLEDHLLFDKYIPTSRVTKIDLNIAGSILPVDTNDLSFCKEFVFDINLLDSSGNEFSECNICDAKFDVFGVDSAMIFVPAPKIIESLSAGSSRDIFGGICYGSILDAIEKLRKNSFGKKILTNQRRYGVTIVLSMLDCVDDLPNNADLGRFMSILYNDVVKPLSAVQKEFYFGVCGVSVFDQKNRNLKLTNLDMPLVFASMCAMDRKQNDLYWERTQHIAQLEKSIEKFNYYNSDMLRSWLNILEKLDLEKFIKNSSATEALIWDKYRLLDSQRKILKKIIISRMDVGHIKIFSNGKSIGPDEFMQGGYCR